MDIMKHVKKLDTFVDTALDKLFAGIGANQITIKEVLKLGTIVVGGFLLLMFLKPYVKKAVDAVQGREKWE